MSADKLAVWMYGGQVAAVERTRRGLRLSYTAEVQRRFPPGSPLLSLSLPLRAEPYPNGVTTAFLDGLLPEEGERRVLAQRFGLVATDTFGLVRELGRDCAGALVIQPEDQPAPRDATTVTAEPLTGDALAALVANLRNAPLGVGDRVRISLAGVQEKLLLTRLTDGTWGRPTDGTPSTHILKPQVSRFGNTVENEEFCMRLAANLGLPVAAVERIHVGSAVALLVARFDRQVAADGAVTRVHQEDLCQAFGLPPSKKYEEDGGPGLVRLAGALGAVDPTSLDALLRATVVNVLVGNGDAHAKNFAILHEPADRLRFAPLYDLLATLIYGDDRLAMTIDNVHRTDRVTGDRLLSEAARWGMNRERAARTVADLLDRVPDAVAVTRESVPDVPTALLELIEAQLAPLRVGTS